MLIYNLTNKSIRPQGYGDVKQAQKKKKYWYVRKQEKQAHERTSKSTGKLVTTSSQPYAWWLLSGVDLKVIYS